MENFAVGRKKHNKSLTLGENSCLNGISMQFQYTDGGRSRYFTGVAGDCVTRAFAVALGINYLDIYQLVNRYSKLEKDEDINDKVKGIGIKVKRSSANGGVYPVTIQKIAESFQLKFTKKYGKPTYLSKKGIYIVLFDAHISCVKDGVVLDTHDCSDMFYYGYYKVSQKNTKKVIVSV
jgi:hypothetical protein